MTTYEGALDPIAGEEVTAERLIVADQDIVGEGSQDFIPINLDDASGPVRLADGHVLDDLIVADNFVGHDVELVVSEPRFETVPQRDGGDARDDDDEDDAIRELAFTGDGI